MGIYGRMEAEYYQVTPMGMARVQRGQLGHIDSISRSILAKMVELGGTAEIDELKFHGTDTSPAILRESLKRLADLGYVTPVTFQEQRVGGLTG